MDTVKTNQAKVLAETVAYYSEDTNRRCKGLVDGLKQCFYSPTKLGKEAISEGCAVGRLVTQELRELLDKGDTKGAIGGSSISNSTLFNMLPPDVQALGQVFLLQLQELHDGDSKWIEGKGLSERGKKFVGELEDDYDLN